MKHNVLFLFFCLLMTQARAGGHEPISGVVLPAFKDQGHRGSQLYVLARLPDIVWQTAYWASLSLRGKIESASEAMIKSLNKLIAGEGKASGTCSIDGKEHNLYHASSGIDSQTFTYFFVVIGGLAHIVALAQHKTATSYKILDQIPGVNIVNTGDHYFSL